MEAKERSKRDRSDFMCPICLSILIEPVTMPCKHCLCKPCFDQNVEVTSLNCPFCKTRIGTWCRKSKKDNKIIDHKLWKIIQEDFPDEVRKRLEGLDDSINEAEESFPCLPIHNFCEEGEIKADFEKEMEKLQEDERKKREEEIKKSEEYIKQLQLIEKTDSNRQSVATPPKKPLGPLDSFFNKTPRSNSSKAIVTSKKTSSDSSPPTASVSCDNSTPSSSRMSDIENAADGSNDVFGFDPDIVQQQLQCELRLKQELADAELARKLQLEFDKQPVKSSPRQYGLRDRHQEKQQITTKKRPRQLSIEDTMNLGKKKKLA